MGQKTMIDWRRTRRKPPAQLVGPKGVMGWVILISGSLLFTSSRAYLPLARHPSGRSTTSFLLLSTSSSAPFTLDPRWCSSSSSSSTRNISIRRRKRWGTRTDGPGYPLHFSPWASEDHHLPLLPRKDTWLDASPQEEEEGENSDQDYEDDDDDDLDNPGPLARSWIRWEGSPSPTVSSSLQQNVEPVLPTAAADPEEEVDFQKPQRYTVRIDGAEFQTGPLSARFWEALPRALLDPSASDEHDDLTRSLLEYALEWTAQQAVRAALRQEGLLLCHPITLQVMDDDEDDPKALPITETVADEWRAKIDSIQLHPWLNSSENENQVMDQPSLTYASWEEAIDRWRPGQAFDFTAQGVVAKLRPVSVDELIQTLDPDGQLRQQAQQAGVPLPNLSRPVVDDDNEDDVNDTSFLSSLRDMIQENTRRVELAPREAYPESRAFAGTTARGYRALSARDCAQAWSSHSDQLPHHDDPNKNNKNNNSRPTMMHVMDALVGHGCLLVDVTDQGRDWAAARILAGMWRTTQHLFEQIQQRGAQDLPPMATVPMENSSVQSAKLGFVSFQDGDMQFLETRVDRSTGILQPQLGTEWWGPAPTSEHRNNVKESIPLGPSALQAATDLMMQVAKDVIRIAVAASSVEAGAFGGDRRDSERWMAAAQAAQRLAHELVDDGKPLILNDQQGNTPRPEPTMSMSPHRLCRYANQQRDQQGSSNPDSTTHNKMREVFGAHTDTTFLTAVPVAAVSGLEVYDESVQEWYRPELAARNQWLASQSAERRDLLLKQDPSTWTDHVIETGEELPWHARYVAFMPGEFLQIATRHEVMAAVHRVVMMANRDPASLSRPSYRLSAPLLLRGRLFQRLDVKRYLGGAGYSAFLRECDGQSMGDLHERLQPPPTSANQNDNSKKLNKKEPKNSLFQSILTESAALPKGTNAKSSSKSSSKRPTATSAKGSKSSRRKG